MFAGLEAWSDGLAQETRSFLQKALENGSMFALDVVQFVGVVTECLLAAAGDGRCPAHTARELQRNALWLAWTLSWVPRTEEAVHRAKNVNLTE